MATRQLSLQGFSPRLEHGGELRSGKRKLARPIDPRRPMHVVLRSSRARGKWSLHQPGNSRAARALTFGLAAENGVRVYEYANVGNHLHLLVRAKTRRGFQRYLRTLAGLLARKVTGACKGNPINGSFWDNSAYSRVVEWGRGFLAVKKYVVLNRIEAQDGFVGPGDRALADALRACAPGARKTGACKPRGLMDSSRDALCRTKPLGKF